jgi:hypothetical protein
MLLIRTLRLININYDPVQRTVRLPRNTSQNLTWHFNLTWTLHGIPSYTSSSGNRFDTYSISPGGSGIAMGN